MLKRRSPTPAPEPEPEKRVLTYNQLMTYMRNSGRGYAAAAAHFGVPELQLRALTAAKRRHPGGPGAGGAEPYRAPIDDGIGGVTLMLGDDIQPPEMEDLDPSKATTEEFLAHRLEHALKMVTAAVRGGSPNIAKNWEQVAQKTRKDLDVHRENMRRLAEERGRADIADPAAIARRIAAQAPALVALAPDECMDLLHKLAAALNVQVGGTT